MNQKKTRKKFPSLLCIDGASQVIEHDKEDFVNLMAELYDQCSDL